MEKFIQIGMTITFKVGTHDHDSCYNNFMDRVFVQNISYNEWGNPLPFS